jgi:hypothetical protein
VVSDHNSVNKVSLGWRSCAAVFAIATVATALHHVLEPGVKVALLFDGRHYFESCQRVTALILAAVSMKPAAVVAAEQALRQFIMLDGPILPCLFGAVFASFGHIPVSSDWIVIIAVQTMLHALAAVLVSKLAFQLTRNKKIAYFCAALWTFYPAAVIASGRLMTESIAVVLLLCLPLALRGAVRSVPSADVQPSSILQRLSTILSGNPYGFAAGIVSGLLILLKPGMIPSVVLCWIAALAMTQKRLVLALALAIGAGLALSPWLLYTKQTTGKAAITVQRMPVHNALIGWDPETSGWQTNPPSGFERAMNTGGEPLTVIEGIWLSHPHECLTILGEKFGHLYSTPWNDYRAKAFLLNVEAQGLYHYILLFAGLSGLFSWLLGEQRKNKLAILCVSTAAGQCVYLMFEPVCRYAFPQFVFAPILFAFTLLHLTDASRNLKVVFVAAGLSIGCVGLIAFSESLAVHRLDETTHFLDYRDQAIQTISLEPSASKNAALALLLVDGDKNLENDLVEVNGHNCEGHLLPFNYYDPQRYQAFNLLKELGYGLNVPVDDFRLWRAIPVPVELIKDGKLEIKITSDTNGSTIYGDQHPGRNYLSPDFLCVNRLINSKASMEMRNQSPMLAGQSSHQSSLRDSDGTHSLSDSLRIKLLLAQPIAESSATDEDKKSSIDNPNISANSKTSTKWSVGTLLARGHSKKAINAPTVFRKDLVASNFDENLRGQDGNIKISKSILKAAHSTGAVIRLPDFGDATNLAIALSGQVRSGTKEGSTGVVVETITDQKNECLLARLPYSIQTNKEWCRFDIKDIAPYISRQGRIVSISVALFPGPWQQVAGYGCDKSCTDSSFRDLKLDVSPSSLPSLSGMHLSYF